MDEPQRDGNSRAIVFIAAAVAALLLGVGLMAVVVAQGEVGSSPIGPEGAVPLPPLADGFDGAGPSRDASSLDGARGAAATPGDAPAPPSAGAATTAPSPDGASGRPPGAAGPATAALTPRVGDRDAGPTGGPAGADVDEDDDRRGFTHVYAPDATGIRAAMTEAKPLIAECYAAWLRAHPDLGGKVVVTFTIADPPTGSADDDADQARITRVAIADSTVDHALLEGCVMNVAAGLRFDRPDGGTLSVSYPFVFAAQSP
ncbi:MAG: AgmX/PglI C-terminal domain-containing protein [Myxococcota bacterium]